MRYKVVYFCDKIIFICLCAIAFFLPISKAIIESLSCLIIAAYLFKKAAERKFLPKTPLNLPILAYVAICFFSVFLSSSFKISLRTFLAKLLQDAVFLFAVIETFNNERRIKSFLYILFLSSAILGIDGIYQYFTHKDFIRHRRNLEIPRIYACFHTPNAFGCYLSVVIPFLLAFLFNKTGVKLSKVLLGALFIFLFACLILTVSRGAWLAFVASILFMSIWLHVLGIIFLALGIFVVASLTFFHPFIKARLVNFFNFLDTSSIDRRIIWHAGWKMFVSRPLLGVGLGTFMFNFAKFVEPGYPYGAPYAHNCYLQKSAETGVIGLLSFLLILVLFFYKGIMVINQTGREKGFFWYILLACLAAILGYCVQMGVDTILYSLDLGMLFWLILGLGVALMRNIEEEKKGVLA